MTQLRRIYLAAGVLIAGISSTQGMVLAGSDLLAQPVRDALTEGFAEQGLVVSLSLDGSLLGMEALQNGKADACILALPDGQDQAGNLRSFPVAFQVVTFLVHSTNPIRELSYNQLSNLFGSTGGLETWSSLTKDVDWLNRKISLWASRSQTAITLQIFNSMVLHGSSLKQDLRYATGTDEELLAIVVQDASALVLAPALTRSNPSVRTLAVKTGEARQAYTPSPDNVLFGDYPLRLPFSLVVKAGMGDAEIAKLLTVIYSPEVTKALENSQFMPIPATERRSILAQYD